MEETTPETAVKKVIKGFSQEIGQTGAMASGDIGIEGEDVVATMKVSYPLNKIVEPATKVINDLVDKVEQWIPGDQTGAAQKLKDEAREQLVKLIQARA